MPNDLQQNLRITTRFTHANKKDRMPAKVGFKLALIHKLVYLMQG